MYYFAVDHNIMYF